MFGLRFSNGMESEDYRAFPGFDADASQRFAWEAQRGGELTPPHS
jgi:hypothetical protein